MFYPVGHAIQQLVDFILPPRCVCCDNTGQLFCDDCQKNITWIKAPVCACCGRPLDETNKLCVTCRESSTSNLSIRAATLFKDPIAKAIHQFKYYNGFGLARPLANLMAQKWDDWGSSDEVDVIAAIPLHESRLEERGYNQSALISSHFSQLTGLSCNNQLLIRTRHTPPQARLNATERAENVQDAFALFQDNVHKKHVLLIDDVCTTGATIFSAAETLFAAGARQVSAYCLARAA